MAYRSLKLGLAAAAIVASALAGAQTGMSQVWTRSSLSGRLADHLQWVSRYETFRVDNAQLRAGLSAAPLEGGTGFQNFGLIELPNPNGEVQIFKVENSPIQTPAMERKSNTHTYRVASVQNPSIHGRVDIGPNGFNGFIRDGERSYIISPPRIGVQDQVVVYYRSDNEAPNSFRCFTQPGSSVGTGNLRQIIINAGDTLKTYRLAMNATGEYTTFYGSQAAAMNGVVTSVNRVNTPYQDDVAIRLNIVYNMCYTNAATDPYTNNNGSAMLSQNQTTCDTNVGNANYDIGHVFSTGGGGIASLNSVGVTGRKAMGVTGGPAPIGDPFDIDYVAHEMGHQYGGNHTFANCSGSAGPVPYEPGSGTTIMAYAGICGAQDVQPHSDAYFHLVNLIEITAWRDNPASGGTAAANGNFLPTANAGLDYTVPANTPIKLTATGSDGNGDPLKYCWEIWETGVAGATNRSYTATSSPTRFIPPFANVLANTANQWDPILGARTARFRVTTRDNRVGGGGYGWDEMTVTATGAAFSVTSPNTAVSWAGGSTQTVTWAVGGSGGTANVRILLSTDGGNSYANGTATVLLASTPNDGSQTVTIPNTPSTTARIIVEGVSNIFYDISNVNFTITNTNNPVPTLTSMSPSSATAAGAGFNLVVTGTNFVNGSIVRWNGANRTTTFNSGTQLTASIPASDIAFVGTPSVTVFNPTPGGGTSNALTFTVNPIVLAPNAFSRLQGDAVSGGLADVGSSNNAYLVGAFRWDLPRLTPNLQWEFSHTSPASTASRIDVLVESNTNPGGLSQRIEVFNVSTNTWDLKDTFTTTTTDSVRTLSITTGASQYVAAGGIIKVRVGYFPIAPTGRVVQASIDQVQITHYP